SWQASSVQLRSQERLAPRSVGSGCPWLRLSSDDFEEAIPAYCPRPAPERPGMLAFGDGEEDHLGATDQILLRHIADLAEEAAIGGVVAVVAHHEEVAGRHGVDVGVV